MPEQPLKVCVIDDDDSVRRSLRRLLEANGLEVTSFGDAQSYLKQNPDQSLGCIILDIRMPEIDGLELQAVLNEMGQTVPIVFLTGHGDIPMSVRAVKAGAVDFLTKPVDEAVLLQAVANAFSLQRQRTAEVDRRETISDRIASLTPREREVMSWVITGATNKRIAAELSIAEKTVKIHRSRVMHKLEVASVAALLLDCQLVGIEPAEKL